jgi:2-dehydropantoate 2-reductase
VITLGERNNTRTPRLEKFVECLTAAELQALVPDNIQVALWEKFEFIASFGGVGAVTRAPVGVMRSVPEARSLLDRAMQEIMGLARACGIPVRSESVAETMKFAESLPPDGTASMQRDLIAGRPSELEAQSGAVVTGARVYLQRPTAWRTACPRQADGLNVLRFLFPDFTAEEIQR